MRAPPAGAWAWAVLAVLLTAGAVVASRTAGVRAAAGLGAGAIVALGASLTMWGRSLGHDHTEERHHDLPNDLSTVGRRRLLVGLGALGAAVMGGLLVVPAALRTSGAADRLRRTGWDPGTALVDDAGRRIVAAEMIPGNVLTVYPEGRVGEAQSQALLLSVEPERVRVDPAGSSSPEGLLAYSKLCTHMACPVGLYQEASGTVVCPCHQAVFDLLAGGEPLIGPARRPLPGLPIEVDGDGYLVASGGFTDIVGTAFWSVP